MTVVWAGALVRQVLVDVTGDARLVSVADDVALLRTGVGLSSLTATELLREIETRSGVDVAAVDLDLACMASVGALARLVADAVNHAALAQRSAHARLTASSGVRIGP